jgi:hypothetical protein
MDKDDVVPCGVDLGRNPFLERLQPEQIQRPDALVEAAEGATHKREWAEWENDMLTTMRAQVTEVVFCAREGIDIYFMFIVQSPGHLVESALATT